MMRLKIDGHEYTAQSATELIHQIKGLHWHTTEETTAEEYIHLQEQTFRKITGRRMQLGKGDTEARAREMFRQIAGCGNWIFEEGGSDDE